jgi:hypothetical protein
LAFGSARWATTDDIRKAGLDQPAGVFLGLRTRQYLRHEGPEHVLTFAPTRSGKGVGLVIPTLLSWPASAVIHDIKGENWSITAGWRSRLSHCLLFNPTDAKSVTSHNQRHQRGHQSLRKIPWHAGPVVARVEMQEITSLLAPDDRQLTTEDKYTCDHRQSLIVYLYRVLPRKESVQKNFAIECVSESVSK